MGSALIRRSTGLVANQPLRLQERALGAYPVTYQGVLDGLSSVVAGYSVRRLRSAYAGACMRVRRSSDNVEQDIGFTPRGNLDTIALLSFIGTSSGMVVTWYDQSGSGNNATQSTAGDQPAIVTSGAMELMNSRPALKFDGKAMACIPIASALSAATLAGFAAVSYNNAGAAYGRIVAFGDAANVDYTGGNVLLIGRQNSNQAVVAYAAAERANKAITYGTAAQISSVFDGSNHNMYVDGAVGTASAYTTSFTSVRLHIGYEPGVPTNRANMVLGELFVVAASVSSTRAIIEANQKAYFYTP
jgi:hypothetical protein